MKTTITIDDRLLSHLEQRAVESGSTVSRLIEQAVAILYPQPHRAQAGSEPFTLPTFGRGGRFSRYDVNKTSELLELDDVERFGRSTEP